MTEYEGIRFPAIDQLDKKASSKYKLVIATAIRARQIKYHPDCILIEKPVSKKPIGRALEEIYENKIEIENK
jgi:DNA-directed RNA polymerase subunit omega